MRFALPTCGHRLPSFLRRRLFGDRDQFGLVARTDDPDWHEWMRLQLQFYEETQKQSAGKIVNDAGYTILRQVDWAGKRVLEIGPGDLPHARFWRNKPAHYTLVDVSGEMLARSGAKLSQLSVPHVEVETDRVTRLPFADRSFDCVVSFYSFEHIYPLGPYLAELRRVLTVDGTVIGGVPAEGGLAWGLARFMTTRRWFRRHSSIDPDKLICWEHPNFSDTVLAELDRHFDRVYVRYWPLRVPSADVNLLVLFAYRQKSA